MHVLSRRAFAASALAFAATPSFAAAAPPKFAAAAIGGGIDLHYVEQGGGPPLIFVHGSLSDYSYWKPQFPYFTPCRRVIAYSRRYNWPNDNPTQPNYSAITDADDLAGFIAALGLKRPVIVGHSYGALTALFFAMRHPGIAPAIVLAEAPAVSLLNDVEGADAAKAKAMYADIQARMVAPMRAAFAEGAREKGVAVFIDYVFGRPDAWADCAQGQPMLPGRKQRTCGWPSSQVGQTMVGPARLGSVITASSGTSTHSPSICTR